jgi:hypothetical protein
MGWRCYHTLSLPFKSAFPLRQPEGAFCPDGVLRIDINISNQKQVIESLPLPQSITMQSILKRIRNKISVVLRVNNIGNKCKVLSRWGCRILKINVTRTSHPSVGNYRSLTMYDTGWLNISKAFYCCVIINEN